MPETTEVPKKVEVRFAYEESGYCRTYYRTIPGGQLICRQANEGWYTVIEDGTWNEPAFGIDEDKYEIVILGEGA